MEQFGGVTESSSYCFIAITLSLFFNQLQFFTVVMHFGGSACKYFNKMQLNEILRSE